MSQRNRDHGGGEWKVDEKCPSPGSVLDEPTTQNGTQGCGHGGGTGPGADGSTAFRLVKRRADNCEASRHQERSSHSLNGAGDYELPNCGGQPAPRRRKRKYGDTG